MEIQGKDGSRTRVNLGSKIQFGRGHGFNSTDRTVSRRHVSFQMDHRQRRCGEDEQEQPTLHFEVVGRNPIWVHSQKTGKVGTFRRFDNGEIENGDMFCVSAENPIWFTVRKAEFEEENERSGKRELGLENEFAESLESSLEPEKVEELEIEDVDFSNIDPVKEFGLVIMGHEFDDYSKKMIRDARKWEWFIEEPGDESEYDDEVEERRRKKRPRRKKKKGEENDDEEWTGESEVEEEEQKELLTKLRKVQKPVYTTRSKDRRNAKPSGQRKTTRDVDEDAEDEDEDEDDDDETLGGFIVADEEEDQMDEDDEEEEEFVEDEDEE